MAITDPQTKADFDNNALDDPKAAFTELAGNVDTYNALVALLKVICTLNIGDGLKDDGAGNLDLDLGTNPGLEIVSTKLVAKVLAGAGLKKTANGLELDIEGATSETVVDPANDTVLMKDNSAVTTSKVREVKVQDIAPGLSANSVTQTEMADAAIGQAELKTATGENSTLSEGVLITGPGGQYGFWPEIKDAAGFASVIHCSPGEAIAYNGSWLALSRVHGSTYLQRFSLGVFGGVEGQRKAFARQRYIQASPPYDLGDGPVHSFIFAIVNKNGKIETVYHAPEPPWANNGPTCIHADRICKKTGKRYRTITKLKPDMMRLMDRDFLQEEEFEITPEFKNSDMNLIPHPFQGNDLKDKSIVLIDPMSPIVERLEQLKNTGDDAGTVIYGDYLRIGNEELGRGRPAGVMSVSVKMKNSRG